MRRKGGFVYLTFSKKNGTIYTGVTSDIIRRMYEHKNKIFKGFTYRYNADKLGYYEYYEDMLLQGKKQLKTEAGNIN